MQSRVREENLIRAGLLLYGSRLEIVTGENGEQPARKSSTLMRNSVSLDSILQRCTALEEVETRSTNQMSPLILKFTISSHL